MLKSHWMSLNLQVLFQGKVENEFKEASHGCENKDISLIFIFLFGGVKLILVCMITHPFVCRYFLSLQLPPALGLPGVCCSRVQLPGREAKALESLIFLKYQI